MMERKPNMVRMGLVLFIVGVGAVLISGVAAALIKLAGFGLMAAGLFAAVIGFLNRDRRKWSRRQRRTIS